MIGLAFLALIFAYLWLAKVFAVAAFKSSKWLAVVVLAVFVSAPLVDAIAGRVELKSRCEREARIVVERRAAAVEGIRVAGAVYEDSPRFYGYEYVESSPGYGHSNARGGVDRATHGIGRAKPVVERQVEPMAKYALTEGSPEITTYFRSSHIAVVEIDSQREMAHFDWVQFRGGWAEKMMGAFSDAGSGTEKSCGSLDERIRLTRTMLHTALPPVGPQLATGE